MNKRKLNYLEWINKNIWLKYYYKGNAIITIILCILFIILSIIIYNVTNNTIRNLIACSFSAFWALFFLTVSAYFLAIYNIMNRCSKKNEHNDDDKPYKPIETKNNK